MSYVVTIFTEKHLYRVNIEEGTKYTIGSGEKDAFPMLRAWRRRATWDLFSCKKTNPEVECKKNPFVSKGNERRS